MNNNIKAILLTVSGSFFAVLMESLIRSAQYDSNVYTIGFLRFLFGLIIIFPTPHHCKANLFVQSQSGGVTRTYFEKNRSDFGQAQFLTRLCQ